MLHTITDITVTKKGRYALFFDGMFLFSIDDETYFKSHIKIGDKLEDSDLDELNETTQVKGAKSYALHLLSYKSYTRKMLLDKLCTKFDMPFCEIAVDRMKELGLIDDLDYAMRYSRDLVNLKRYSLRRVEQELKRKGISAEFILEALQQFDELDTELQIYKIIEKKYINKLEDEKQIRRAINGLMRLGYGFSDIKSVIKNLAEDMQYYCNY